MIDLKLSEDQTQIVTGAVDLLAAQFPVSRLRPGGIRADETAALAEWGWFGVGLPEDEGGLGLGIADEALLFAEVGRFALSPSVLATTLAAHLAEGELKSLFVSGEARAALALKGAESAFAFDRGDAEHLLVFTEGGARLAPASAFEGQVVDGFDETVRTEKGLLEDFAENADATDDRARLLVAAMLAGIARAACDLAVDYAKVREQFGQPIGGFQAIKHICADMAVCAYAAEAQVKLAAATAQDAPQEASSAINAAALVSLKAARRNAEDAIQVHGGIGFTAECDAHVFLKRAHLLSRLLGGPDACRNAVLGG